MILNTSNNPKGYLLKKTQTNNELLKHTLVFISPRLDLNS